MPAALAPMESVASRHSAQFRSELHKNEANALGGFMRGAAGFAGSPDLGMDRGMAIIDAIGCRSRVLAAGFAGLVVGLGVPPANGETQQSASAITCTNPVSGASWQITIDYRNATVDANPAAITAAAISWFDPKDGGNYTLDRKSGALTASVASSTGGYFRHGRCALETGR